MVKNSPVPKMTGRKKMALAMKLPWNFWCSSTATKNENTKQTGTLTARSSSDCAAYRMKFSSLVKALTKFSIPTHRADSPPPGRKVTFWKLTTAECTSGQQKNKTKPISHGIRKRSPDALRLRVNRSVEKKPRIMILLPFFG